MTAMAGENLSGASGGSDDFVVTSSGSSGFTAAAEPAPPATPAEPAPAAPPEPTPPPTTEEAAPTEEPPAAQTEEPPAVAPAGPEVAAAAAALPKGDSKAGKTLSDRGRMIQAEINALTAQKYQTRSETDAARAELAELRAERQRIYQELQARPGQPAPPAQPGQPVPPGQPAAAAEPPKEESFSTFGEFVQATAKYWHDEGQRAAHAKAQELITQTLAQERARQQQELENRQLTEIFAKHNQNVEAARAAHPDFDEVVAGSALPTNPMMEAHIPRSPISGELLHYLATHPDETVQIAQMSAGPTLVALGRLEARIEAAKSGPAPVRPQLVSKAKPPIKPVGASGGTTADEVPDPLTSSLDEHNAYWNRKDRERRGGRR